MYDWQPSFYRLRHPPDARIGPHWHCIMSEIEAKSSHDHIWISLKPYPLQSKQAKLLKAKILTQVSISDSGSKCFFSTQRPIWRESAGRSCWALLLSILFTYNFTKFLQHHLLCLHCGSRLLRFTCRLRPPAPSLLSTLEASKTWTAPQTSWVSRTQNPRTVRRARL